MPEEAGSSVGENANAEPDGAPAAEREEVRHPTPTFQPITSQKEFDRLVYARLAREREKLGDPSSVVISKTHHEELKSKAGKLAEIEEANKTELERERDRAAKAEEKANSTIEAANRRLVEAAVLAEATRQKAVKPEHLHKLIDTDSVTVGDDGQVTGAQDAVKAFLEANPEYVGAGRASGSADQGARKGGANQLSRDDLKTMSPDEINKARREGRLDSVLGVA